MKISIEESIQFYGKKIDTLLKEFIPPERDDNLSEPIWHHLRTGGKRIRPAICLITCEELGGNPDDALHFALAIEILHNMFLLHDDIEDGDTMRRDQPTVWVKYGIANAVNAGDYLLARAYQSVLASPIPLDRKMKLLEIFTDTYEKTVQGQALDIDARAARDFSVKRYLDMVELKTGFYLACGMVGGSIVSGGSHEVIDKIWKLGKLMGPAFQIKDDLIDLTIGKGRGGVIGSDIKEGKASFLYAYAYEIADKDDKEILARIMAKERETTTEKDIKDVLDIYGKYGAMESAQNHAEELTKQAKSVIDDIPVHNKEVFREIANFMIERMT
ncbi:MAG: polyprenyl synthetase family protein [Candidatus Scalindua sp. AMX11]|nr:MAG: polyprenyl synthetase family protein [Candidatus Scalindua sp.]NOG83270.1 polyprenyl synthetase family protein [Planctomycetota bacterium]RZV71968.1 MAG: polyprenyl synthetase family protein [Candidatus Scalindua sp. SCAELEC01]TDE63336.1 MAG: polyprenyl synthetase family protein [Candidatus Scalindua sp. AMX11]GJQ60040.1 MAG: serralysin [Candidatus Scalindua sp.]